MASLGCTPPSLPSVRRTAGVGHEVREGLRYVRRHVWLWGTFVSASLTYLLFVGPTQVLLPYIVRNTLHQSASAYGIVLAAGGWARWSVPSPWGGHVTAEPDDVDLRVVDSGHARRDGVRAVREDVGAVLASLVINGAEAVGAVVWATLKQRRVPVAMLGRVSSIDWLVSTALLPLSYTLTPPVARLFGASLTLVLAGTVGAVVTLGFLFCRACAKMAWRRARFGPRPRRPTRAHDGSVRSRCDATL